MEYKVTKITKYGKGVFCSEKIGVQYYNVVYCRVYTDSTKKQYYKVRFIIMFDVNDVCDYFDADSVTQDQIKEYRDEIAYNTAYDVCGSNKTIDGVIRDANYLIERYK